MIIIIIFSPYFILINCPKYSLGLRWGASGEVVVARSVINVRMMNGCPGINSQHDMRLQSLTYSPTTQSIKAKNNLFFYTIVQSCQRRLLLYFMFCCKKCNNFVVVAQERNHYVLEERERKVASVYNRAKLPLAGV